MSEEEQKYFKGLIGFTFDSDDIRYIEKIVDKKDKEINRLNKIIYKLEEFIEKEIELYTVELTEENKNILGYTAPIRGVYKEIYNVLQELKGEDKE